MSGSGTGHGDVGHLRITVFLSLLLALILSEGLLHGDAHPSASDELSKTIREIFQAEGEGGVRDYVRTNKGIISSDFIRSLASSAVRQRNEDDLKISRAMAEESTDEKTMADVFCQYGKYFGHLKEFAKAQEMYDCALSFYLKLNDYGGQGNAYFGKSKLSLYKGDRAGAVEMLGRAEPLLEQAQDLVGLGNVKLSRGLIAYLSGDNAKALDAYQEAMDFFENAGFLIGQGNALKSMGEVFQRKGENAKAIGSYERAMPLFVKADDIQGQANIYLREGDLYLEMCDVARAREQYGRALPLYSKIKDVLDLGNVHLMLGEIRYRTGDFAGALDMYGNALSYFVKAEYPYGQGHVALSLAEVFQYIADYPKALEMLERALAFYVQVGNPTGQANVYRCLGTIHCAQGEYLKAMEMCEKARPLSIQVEDWQGLGNVLSLEGEILLKTNEYPEALERLDAAMTCYVKNDHLLGQGNVLRHQADVYFHMGENEKAMDKTEEALRLYQGMGDIASEASGKLLKARLLSAGGAKEEAMRLFEEGLALQEKVRLQAGITEMKASLMRKAYEDYEAAAVFALENGFPEKAFRITESVKARAFLDMLAEGLVNLEEGIPPELKQRRDEVENRLSILQKQRVDAAQNEKTDEAKPSAIGAQIQKTESELEEVRTQIRLKNPLYASVRYPESVTVSDLQKVLRPDEAVLKYFLTRESAYCFVVGARSFEARKLSVKPEELRRLTSSWVSRIRSPGSALADGGGTELHKSLVGPVQPFITGKKLIVISDGIVARLPFEGLPVSDGNGTEYMLEKFAIKYVQSASVLRFLRTQYAREATSDWFIGFGDPVYDYENFKAGRPEKGGQIKGTADGSLIDELTRSGYARAGGRLTRLEGSGIEVEGIAALFRGRNKREKVNLRLDAREENAKSNDIASYGYIHFSAHGVLDDRFQAVALSQIPDANEDGFLTVREIMTCRYNARLVVLSACETGLGKSEEGEGVTGLTRAVMYAGSPAAVVSLWDVSDVATMELMTRFYGHMLGDGMSKEEALRQAKVDLLRTVDYTHPFFWGAFVMYGE